MFGRTPSSRMDTEALTSPLALSPLEAVADDVQHPTSWSNNQSMLSLATNPSGTPSRRVSGAEQTSSLSRSAGVTTLLRPAGEGSSAAGRHPTVGAMRHSPNTSPHTITSSLVQTDWASGSEFAGVSELSGLRGVQDAAGPLPTALPGLTAVSFSAIGNSSRSVGGVTTPPPPTGTCSGGAANTACAASAAACEVSAITVGSAPSRSMTLLERRSNRERSMMSISCLSGLNVETIQASIRDGTGGNGEDSAQKESQSTRGWSKAVASAALLCEYAVPAVGTAASSTTTSTGDPPAASPAAFRGRQLPAATPAFRSTATTAFRRASNGGLSLGPDLANCFAVTPSAQHQRRGSKAAAAVAAAAAAAAATPRTLDAIPGAVKVASYNILASRLASTDLYPHCPPSYLSEEYRLELVKQEISAIDPDILLMEEISVAVHEESLGPFLKSALGLEGHHVVVTDRLGHPRCSTRPATASDTSPPKHTSSTRRKFDDLCLASQCGTGEPLAVPGLSSGSRAASEHCTKSDSDGESALPPLVRAGSVHRQPPPLRGESNGPLMPPASRRGSWTPQPAHPGPMSLSSMGNTETTLGTANASAMTPLHGDAMERSSSALELRSIAKGRARADSAMMAAPRKATTPLEPPVAAAAVGGGGSASSPVGAGTETHRRIEMDGVAIYFKASRFRVLEVVPVAFNALAAQEDRLTAYEHQKLQVNSHNVALVTVLHDTHVTGTPHVYIVASVHFIWQRINAQLWQAHELLRVMTELRARYSGADVDLTAAPAAPPAVRRSTGFDSIPTQPPSLAETPLNHDGGRSGLRKEFALPLNPLRQTSVSSRPTTARPDHLAWGSDGGRSTAADTRRDSVASTSMNGGGGGGGGGGGPPPTPSRGGAVVTCVMGGDFNSERGGPVVEYVRTGRVPENAAVMEYWKAPVPHTPLQRRSVTLENREDGLLRALVEGRGSEAGAVGTGVASTVAAHTPLERPRSGPPVLDISTLPPLDDSSFSSAESPPSPTQPSMQPRRQTQSPPPMLSMGGSPFLHDGTDGLLLQPCTPPRRRQQQQQPFVGRSREMQPALLLSPVESVSESSAAVSNSAPTRVAGVTTTAPDSRDETPYRLPNMNAFRFGRGSVSLITSPVSGSLMDTPKRGGGDMGSAPTLPVTPPSRIPDAETPPQRDRGSRAHARDGSPLPFRRSKAAVAVAAGGGGCGASPGQLDPLFRTSPPLSSRHSRRLTTPEPGHGEERSVSGQRSTSTKSGSRSHSASGVESVLSTQFASAGIPMKLAMHASHNTPSAETDDGGWTSEENPQRPQQPPLPPPQQQQQQPVMVMALAGVPSASRPRRLPPTLQPPPLHSPPDGSIAVVSAAPPEHRPAPINTFSLAALNGGGDDGMADAFALRSPLQPDLMEAPPPPRARAKRRSVPVAAVAATAEGGGGGGAGTSTPPSSPRLSRPRTDGGTENPAAAALFTRSAETPLAGGMSRPSPPPPPPPHSLSVQDGTPHHASQPARDSMLSPLSMSSASSGGGARGGPQWPAAAEEATTPSRPARGLLDEVAHALRFSDAYAPYCHRHPSRVSAVNPSSNMEGKVLDHILYEDEHVVCGAVLRLGERQELPNARVPSDHYMVGAVLIPIQELRRA